MRASTILLTAFLFSILSGPSLAEKVWNSQKDGISFSTGDDFVEPVSGGIPEARIQIFSAQKNIQILLAPPWAQPTKKASSEESQKPVTVSQMIEALPVLAEEKKLTIMGEPVKLKVGGVEAVLFELEDSTVVGYQTIFVYVARGQKPYIMLMNYASPRDPDKVKVMRQVLATVKSN